MWAKGHVLAVESEWRDRAAASGEVIPGTLPGALKSHGAKLNLVVVRKESVASRDGGVYHYASTPAEFVELLGVPGCGEGVAAVNKCRMMIFLGWGLWVSVASAEPPDMVWRDAVQAVRAHNPALHAVQETVSRAEFNVKASGATYLPGFSASTGYSQPFNGSSETLSTGVSATQLLYPGLGNQPEKAVAQAALDAARAVLSVFLVTVRFELQSAFANLWHAGQSVALSRRILARRQQNLQLVSARFRAGRENKGAYLRVNAQVEQARFDEVQAQRALVSARLKLWALLGEASDRPVRVAAAWWEEAQVSADPVQITHWAAAHPTVREARATAAAARYGQLVASQSYGPKLSAGISAERSSLLSGSSASTDWGGRLNVTVPIYLFGESTAAIAAARAEYLRREQLVLDAELQARLTIAQQVNDTLDAVQLVRVQKAFVEAAVLRAEIAEAQYSSGLLSYDNWDIIENELISQEKAMLARQRDSWISQAAWERAIGKELSE